MTIINNLSKYNEPLVVRAKITREAINSVLKNDQKIKGPPKFIVDFLKGLPSQHRETEIMLPSLITWSGDYLILPNPDQTNHENLMKDPFSLKNEPEGFGLIAWYIHPSYRNIKHDNCYQTLDLARYGKYRNKDNLFTHKRIHSWSQLRERDDNELEVNNLNGYISGPFDYNNEHIDSLKQLRDDVIIHLQREYGITNEDNVDLYFHTHYSICTTTAHLHIRINQNRHGLEEDKSISLDKIIELLQLNNSQTAIMDEYIKRKYIHKELKSLKFFEMCGFETEIIWNPFYISSNHNINYDNNYWKCYFRNINESIEENFYSSLQSYNEAKFLGDPYIKQLEEMGYSFERGNEYPAPFEKSLEWVAQHSVIFKPAKAFKLSSSKIVFIPIGGDVPEKAEPVHILSPDDFVLMLSLGYFPIGEAIREHTNQTIAEHDLAHMAGFVSNPHFAKCVQEAFRKVFIKMQINPKLREALSDFNSVYSTRLYYMIEVFTCISNESLLDSLVDMPNWKIINCDADTISTFLIEKSRDPVAFAKYLQRLYGNFLHYVNPLGGESRDILNRKRKFHRDPVTGVYNTPGRSRFSGQSLYSLYLNGLAALENKRSTHPDYRKSIIEIHTPFIGALLGTAKLSIENWVLDTVEEILPPNSPIYHYLHTTNLWDHDHPLIKAFCDPNYTSIINYTAIVN